MLKRILLLVLVCVLVIVTICVVRTFGTHAPSGAAAKTPLVTVDASGALQRLSGAVQIRTISEPMAAPNQQAMQALRVYFEQSFPLVHQKIAHTVIGDGSLLYAWEGTDAKLAPILLMGHMDVVPVDETSLGRWKHPPFSGQIAEGYVWGRGSSDDKGAVLSILEAAETLLRQGFTPKRTILFAFGDDEENNGNGAAALVRYLRGRGVRAPELVMDEGGFIGRGLISGVSGDVALVGIAEKGIASVQLLVNAAGGHSSRPPKVTAIGEMSEALVRLEQNQMPAEITPVVGETLDALAPQMGFAERLVVANRWLFGPLLVHSLADSATGNAMVRTTTALTMMNAGVKDNVLPTQASAVANFRILPGNTVEDVLEHVRNVVADKSVDVSLYPTVAADPSPISPTDGPGYTLLAQTIREFFPGAPLAPNLLVARTDSVHYYLMTPNVYRFFPSVRDETDIESIHGINERMRTTDYVKAVQFMAALMQGAQN